MRASGRRHADAVSRALHDAGCTVRVLHLPGLPPKGDVSDYLDAGGTPNDLERLAALCEAVRPVAGKSVGTVGVCVADVERERIRWLWPGRMALGKITILDGDPGLGKSTVYLDLAARLSSGRALAGCEAEPTDSAPASVVIVTCEDSIGDTIRPRLEEAGADLRRCTVVQKVPHWNAEREAFEDVVPALPDHLGEIEEAVRRTEARLLVIDPLFAHLSSEYNSYRDQDVRRALAPLEMLAERMDVAVLIVRHLNKMSGGSALYRGGGSIGIIGAARLALLLGRNPDDENGLVLAPTKSNIGKWAESLSLRIVSSSRAPEVGVIEWDGPCSYRADDLLANPAVRSAAKRDEAAEWLRERLADGEPHPAADIYADAERAGLTERTIKRAKSRLNVVVERMGGVGGSGRWYWSLPREAHPVNGQKTLRGPIMEVGPLSENREAKEAEKCPKQAGNGHFAKGANPFQTGGTAEAVGPLRLVGSKGPFYIGQRVTTGSGPGTIERIDEDGTPRVAVAAWANTRVPVRRCDPRFIHPMEA